jgi:hypothetical protein
MKFTDGPYESAERSVGPSQIVRFSRCTTRGSGSNFGRFAPYPQTVCALLADNTPGHCGQSSWCFPDCLSPLLFELFFGVGLVWDLFLGLVGPL